jgi:CheW-like protein
MEGSFRRSVVKGIACRAGKAELALPFETVGQIIEYNVFALPLARPFIAGLGLHDDWPLISVTLSRNIETPRMGTPRVAKGILLETAGTEVAWALEVDELGTFVDVTLGPRVAVPGLDLPPWIGKASTIQGRNLAWIDVSAMLVALGTEAHS